jgi:hypothetical protein
MSKTITLALFFSARATKRAILSLGRTSGSPHLVKVSSLMSIKTTLSENLPPHHSAVSVIGGFLNAFFPFMEEQG